MSVVWDVYLLALHEPYRSSELPVPINATIVHALTLLHRRIPQPDGGLIYRCLTEFPRRSPGCVVPVSTLTYELNGGRGWALIGDWERVVDAVVKLARAKECDSMPLGLPPLVAQLLSHGPYTLHDLHFMDGTRSRAGAADRRKHLHDLTRRVANLAAQRPLWPGEPLLHAPTYPPVMPYLPLSRESRWPWRRRRR